MAVKIRLKNSVVAGKVPTPADLDIGELAINAHATSPAAYIKNTAGQVINLVGPATTSAKGVAQLADAAAVAAGTADRVVTADQLKATNDAVSAASAGGITALSGTAPITVTGTGNARTLALDIDLLSVLP